MNDNKTKSQADLEGLMAVALDTMFLGNLVCYHNKKRYYVKDVFAEAARCNAEYSTLCIRQQVYIGQLQADVALMAMLLCELRKIPQLASSIGHCLAHLQTINPVPQPK